LKALGEIEEREKNKFGENLFLPVTLNFQVHVFGKTLAREDLLELAYL
jgi:hypothetical protein